MLVDLLNNYKTYQFIVVPLGQSIMNNKKVEDRLLYLRYTYYLIELSEVSATNCPPSLAKNLFTLISELCWTVNLRPTTTLNHNYPGRLFLHKSVEVTSVRMLLGKINLTQIVTTNFKVLRYKFTSLESRYIFR